MYSLKLVCACFFVFLFGIDAAEKLPDFIHPCKRNSQLSSCIASRVEELRPYLEKGLPQLKLPSINPLYVDSIYIFGEDEVTGQFNGTLSDLEGTGMKEFEIESIEVDVDNLSFKARIRVPYIHLKFFATMDGLIFGFKLDRNNGKFKAALDAWNLDVDFAATGKLFVKGGNPYVNWEDDNTTAVFEKAKVAVTALYEEAEMDEAFSAAMNNHLDAMYKHFMPVFRKTLSKFLLEALNHIHQLYSLDVLYPLK